MLSANLAIVYAQRGKKVLLVDGDLRTPVLDRCFHLEAGKGLSSLFVAGDVMGGVGDATPVPGDSYSSCSAGWPAARLSCRTACLRRHGRISADLAERLRLHHY